MKASMKGLVIASSLVMLSACSHTKKDMKAANARIAELETEGSTQEQLLEACKQDREKLNKLVAGYTADSAKTEDQMKSLEMALAEAAAREANAQRRLAEYRSMLEQLNSMIDAGQLQVRIERGQLVVALPEAVLFPSGSANLKKDGEKVLAQVAPVLVSLKDRNFQVAGFTDNVPIHTKRFPSNWDLSAARAVVVTELLIEYGMPASRVSAAGYGETHPVASNDTEEGRAQNRRIEIGLLPNLDELPDLSTLENNNHK